LSSKPLATVDRRGRFDCAWAVRLLIAFALPGVVTAQQLPVFDAHVHYSHDAWDMLPPPAAIELLRKAGASIAAAAMSPAGRATPR
jgi:hypothetical protein